MITIDARIRCESKSFVKIASLVRAFIRRTISKSSAGCSCRFNSFLHISTIRAKDPGYSRRAKLRPKCFLSIRELTNCHTECRVKVQCPHYTVRAQGSKHDRGMDKSVKRGLIKREPFGL